MVNAEIVKNCKNVKSTNLEHILGPNFGFFSSCTIKEGSSPEPALFHRLLLVVRLESK